MASHYAMHEYYILCYDLNKSPAQGDNENENKKKVPAKHVFTVELVHVIWMKHEQQVVHKFHVYKLLYTH